MTLRIWSRLLQEALQKTPFFVQCYILSKSISSKNSKSLALADLKSVSLIFPKRYTYNYHESYHDTVIISITLHVTKLHITSFMRVSAALLSDQLRPIRIKI